MAKKHYDWKIGDALPKIGPHSLAKHRILRRYIERYIEIVTATSWQEQLNITFVDGYAGGGRYASGRETVVGSPLIFLEAVAAAEAKLNATRPKGFRINATYIFVDQNPSHTEFLRAEIQSSPFSAELDRSIHIWTADFNERVDDIVQAVRARSPRAGRAVFLLDQYGWSQVAFRSSERSSTNFRSRGFSDFQRRCADRLPIGAKPRNAGLRRNRRRPRLGARAN
jgi:three-Cys-motif partner protein